MTTNCNTIKTCHLLQVKGVGVVSNRADPDVKTRSKNLCSLLMPHSEQNRRWRKIAGKSNHWTFLQHRIMYNSSKILKSFNAYQPAFYWLDDQTNMTEQSTTRWPRGPPLERLTWSFWRDLRRCPNASASTARLNRWICQCFSSLAMNRDFAINQFGRPNVQKKLSNHKCCPSAVSIWVSSLASCFSVFF